MLWWGFFTSSTVEAEYLLCKIYHYLIILVLLPREREKIEIVSLLKILNIIPITFINNGFIPIAYGHKINPD